MYYTLELDISHYFTCHIHEFTRGFSLKITVVQYRLNLPFKGGEKNNKTLLENTQRKNEKYCSFPICLRFSSIQHSQVILRIHKTSCFFFCYFFFLFRHFKCLGDYLPWAPAYFGTKRVYYMAAKRGWLTDGDDRHSI